MSLIKEALEKDNQRRRGEATPDGRTNGSSEQVTVPDSGKEMPADSQSKFRKQLDNGLGATPFLLLSGLLFVVAFVVGLELVYLVRYFLS